MPIHSLHRFSGDTDMWNRDVPPESEAARQPQTSAPATPGHPPGERRMVAWVGKSVVFRGDLTSLEDLTIDGRVEGTIELRDYTLTVGPDAHIEAGITAKTVTVLGTVNGTVTASETVDIRETGAVEGNITSRRLVMADGAMLRGRVDTGSRAANQTKQRGRLTAA